MTKKELAKTYRLEKDFQKKVMVYLKGIPNSFWMKISLSAFNSGGISDVLGLVNGRFCAIELKSATGTPSKLQLLFIKKVKAANGLAGVANCLDDVNNILDIT